MSPLSLQPQLVLFDLDGTLADTAADLAAPVNAMRAERGLAALPLEQLRPFASMGARGLIGVGLGIDPAHADYAALREEFLRRYEQAMCVNTRLFDGMDQVLSKLELGNRQWGVVSNKFERYVRRVLSELGLLARSAITVGGDTTPHSKPHPAPLLHAASLMGMDPAHCIYVGDDLRDVEAGKAAGMITVAAAYGFCGDAIPPQDWGADALIESPGELIALLELA